LSHITGKKGRVVTIIPETWKKIKEFKDKLRSEKVLMKEIWRKETGGSIIYYSLYEGSYLTNKRGYKIYWINSSQKRKQDRLSREERMKKAENKLGDLILKLKVFIMLHLCCLKKWKG